MTTKKERTLTREAALNESGPKHLRPPRTFSRTEKVVYAALAMLACALLLLVTAVSVLDLKPAPTINDDGSGRLHDGRAFCVQRAACDQDSFGPAGQFMGW